jgi:hypothetical protein
VFGQHPTGLQVYEVISDMRAPEIGECLYERRYALGNRRRRGPEPDSTDKQAQDPSNFSGIR